MYPMCAQMCVAKCECPSSTPLWDGANQQCITADECSVADEPSAVDEPAGIPEKTPEDVEDVDYIVESRTEEPPRPRFLLNDDAVCKQEAQPGPCRARQVKWYAN